MRTIPASPDRAPSSSHASRKPWLTTAACTLALLSAHAHAQTQVAAISQAADAAREGNDLPRAVALYRQAVQLDSAYADGWWYLGSIAYGADDYPNARDALTHFLALKPSAAPAFALRGLSEFQLHDYPQSLVDIEKALALGAANQPRNEQLLRLHEGLLLTRDAKFERALQSYLTLANEGVNTPAMTVGLGMAGLRIPGLPQDIPAPQQDMAFAAGQAVLQLLGKAPAAAAGDPAAASDPPPTDAGFATFFATYPHTPNAHYLYGYLLFAADPERAAAEFHQELLLSPNSAPAHAMLAWAALMHSDPDAALAPASAAVSADPTLPLAQLVYGRALLETGSTLSGAQHLERARQLEPDNLETHLALARAYSTSNHPEEARRERLLCLRLTEAHAPAP